LQESERLGKKILPFVVQPVERDRIPPRLASLNSIVFDNRLDAGAFVNATSELERSLKTDVAWLREGTRLAARAAEWASARRSTNRLLSGSDVADARKWLENRPSSAPNVPKQVREFIGASEEFETQRSAGARLRSERFMAAGLALATVLAVAGWWETGLCCSGRDLPQLSASHWHQMEAQRAKIAALRRRRRLSTAL
jgi:hypothetical protein